MRFVTIAVVVALIGAAAAGTPVTVTTEYGPVTGSVEAFYRAFRGIPYAAPPVGDQR